MILNKHGQLPSNVRQAMLTHINRQSTKASPLLEPPRQTRAARLFRATRPGCGRLVRACFAALTTLLALAAGAPLGASKEGGQRPTGHRTEELIFRQEVFPAGPVVTLGDVAELRGIDPQVASWLGSHELFPAPRTGGAVTISRQEIIEQLKLRGANLDGYRLSGAELVRIHPRRPESEERSLATAPAPTSLLANPSQANTHFADGRSTADGVRPATLTDVSTTAQPTRRDGLRSRGRSLVESGDIVNVFVYGAGVHIRTMGRARQNGNLGDWVVIEAPGSRATYRAQVFGPQSVVVHVGKHEENP